MSKERAACLCLFVGAIYCFCQDGGLLDRIKARYEGTSSLYARVDLHIRWKVRETEETKHGSILLAPENKFRIELGTSQWVSDGATVWQYDKAIRQVVIMPLSAVDNSMLPSHAITAYCSRYPLKETSAAGRDETLEWRADSQAIATGATAKLVRIIADRKSAAVKQLFVIDKMGNESTYSFTGIAFGRAAPAGAFMFNVPKGARVLDQR